MPNHLKKNKALKYILSYINHFVSLIILATIVAVVIFSLLKVVLLYNNIFHFNAEEVLRTVALIVILVKAYRLLVYYMQSHHVSVRYIMEIAIIAPTVELIFTPENRSLEMNIIYGVFAIANLILYVMYCQRLDVIDKDLIEEED